MLRFTRHNEVKVGRFETNKCFRSLLSGNTTGKADKSAKYYDDFVFYYVYYLINKNGKHYVGCTNNLKDRLKRHNNKEIEATKFGTPWKLKSCFIFDNQHTAFEFERYLKTGAGRNFMRNHKIWE